METDGEVKVKATYHQHKSQNHQKNVHHFCPHKKQTHRAAHVFDPKKFQDFQVETEVLRRNSTDKHGKFQLGKDLSVYIQVAATEKMPSIKTLTRISKNKKSHAATMGPQNLPF